MSPAFVTRDALRGLLAGVEGRLQAPARVHLVGETCTTWEGWRPWTDSALLFGSAGRSASAAFDAALRRAAADLDIAVVQESPADVIPLPAEYEGRARPAGSVGEHLSVVHFDPYSQAFRFLARGDERDYDLVLAFLEHGWIDFEQMDALLEEVLPRFSMETIQQDPAEFRRRYRGLVQMWRARNPP